MQKLLDQPMRTDLKPGDWTDLRLNDGSIDQGRTVGWVGRRVVVEVWLQGQGSYATLFVIRPQAVPEEGEAANG